MKNDEKPQKEVLAFDKPLETRRIDDKDWFLQMLVAMSNSENGIGIGVTLNVGGLLISGELCSGKKYFYDFGSKLSKAMYPENAENAESIANIYKNLGDEVYTEEDPSSIPPATYLHINNAKFFSIKGDAIPSSEVGFLWRGKISEVDGFSLGTLSKS